jgi:hypothetical protein
METSLYAHPYAEPSPDQATACAFAAGATLSRRADNPPAAAPRCAPALDRTADGGRPILGRRVHLCP